MITRKILCCLMLAYLFPLLAAVQDVIMKRDGNTIVCRIVEVGESEVVYKRWSNLQTHVDVFQNVLHVWKFDAIQRRNPASSQRSIKFTAVNMKDVTCFLKTT